MMFVKSTDAQVFNSDFSYSKSRSGNLSLSSVGKLFYYFYGKWMKNYSEPFFFFIMLPILLSMSLFIYFFIFLIVECRFFGFLRIKFGFFWANLD
jgi:hypothetical protein